MRRKGDVWFSSGVCALGAFKALMTRITYVAAAMGTNPTELKANVAGGIALPWKVTARVMEEEFSAFCRQPRAAKAYACHSRDKPAWRVKQLMRQAFEADLHATYGGKPWFIILCCLCEVPERVVELMNALMRHKVNVEGAREITLLQLADLRHLARNAGNAGEARAPGEVGSLEKKRCRRLRDEAWRVTKRLRDQDARTHIDGSLAAQTVRVPVVWPSPKFSIGRDGGEAHRVAELVRE